MLPLVHLAATWLCINMHPGWLALLSRYAAGLGVLHKAFPPAESLQQASALFRKLQAQHTWWLRLQECA